MVYISKNGDIDTDFALLDMEPSSGNWRVCCVQMFHLSFLILSLSNLK